MRIGFYFGSLTSSLVRLRVSPSSSAKEARSDLCRCESLGASRATELPKAPLRGALVAGAPSELLPTIAASSAARCIRSLGVGKSVAINGERLGNTSAACEMKCEIAGVTHGWVQGHWPSTESCT